MGTPNKRLNLALRADDARALASAAVGAFQRDAPSFQLRGAYLRGSFADGSQVELSDVDAFVLLPSGDRSILSLTDAAKAAARRAFPRVDIISATLEMLRTPGWRRFAPNLRHGSVLLGGEDIRDQLILPSVKDFVAEGLPIYRKMVATFHERVSEGARRNANRPCVTRAPTWAENVEWWTRDLATLVARGASMVVALQSGELPTSRRYGNSMYSQHGATEWREYVAQVDEDCRGRWGYRVPRDAADLRQLGKYCERAPAFTQDCIERLNALQAGTNSE
jgi:hypothetical protein